MMRVCFGCGPYYEVPSLMVRVTHHYTRMLWVPSLLLCTSSVTYAMFAGAITRPMHVILTQGDCAV